jgi:GDPmannose 4,6-dehydratase
MTQKKALITGVTGMDGSHLADLLLSKDFEVHGIVRRSSSLNTARIDHIFDKLHLHFGDLTDGSSLHALLGRIKPDFIWHLGAQSHVKVSFELPEYTADADALGALRMLEATKANCPDAKFYQASTSELYGKVQETPQTETTKFYPRSPYATAKLFAYWSVVNYREMGLFASNGILFNHTGPRRGETFVCRKIVLAAARIKLGLQSELLLGNIEARRDFGWAPEYCEAMYKVLMHDTPDDFVISTGETHSIKEFLEVAFGHVGLDYTKYLGIDTKYFRETEVDLLLGDSSKAKKVLNWEATKKFKEIVCLMVDSDMKRLKK